MAYTFLGYVSAGSTNATTVTTGSLDTTGADFLVAVVATGNNGATVTDSKSNSWSSVTGRSGNDPAIQIFYSVPSSVGSGHTVSVSGGAAPTVFFLAFSGAKQTSPFDQQNGATNTSAATLSTGSITPTENDELIVTGASNTTTALLTTSAGDVCLAGAPLPLVGGQHYGANFGVYVQKTAAAISCTWDSHTTIRMAVTIASFKAAATGGGGGSGASAFAFAG